MLDRFLLSPQIGQIPFYSQTWDGCDVKGGNKNVIPSIAGIFSRKTDRNGEPFEGLYGI